MRVRRARTSCVTSLTILAFALGGIVVNHFARRTLPDIQREVVSGNGTTAQSIHGRIGKGVRIRPCRDTSRM